MSVVWAVLSTVFATGLGANRVAWAVAANGGDCRRGVLDGRSPRSARDPMRRRSRREWLIRVALAVLFVVVNALIRWADVRYLLELGQSAADLLQGGQPDRTPHRAVEVRLDDVAAHPLLGVGWGEFPGYQFDLVRTLGGVEIANNSHNIFLDLLAKTGLGRRRGRAARVGRVVRARACAHRTTCARIFGVTLIGVLLMHALVEYPQQYMFFLLPAMFVFGLLETKSLRWGAEPVSFGVYAMVVFGGLAALYPVYRDYARSEVLYYGARPAEEYGANPSFLFGAWGGVRHGDAVADGTRPTCRTSSEMHRQGSGVVAGRNRAAPLCGVAGAGRPDRRCARYGRPVEDIRGGTARLACATRLRVPALAINSRLFRPSRRRLVKLYGVPSKSVEQDDDDDDDSDAE